MADDQTYAWRVQSLRPDLEVLNHGVPAAPTRRPRRVLMRRAPACWLLALLLAIACGPGRLVHRGQVNETLLAGIKARLAAARGLDFRRPVPARALDRAGMAAAVDADMAHSVTPADRARVETVFARLGLVAPGTRLAPAMQRLFTTQLAAFYDPRTKELAVATSAVGGGGAGPGLFAMLAGRDPVAELVVAHELTHALQDQHWGLPTEAEPIAASHTDRVLARRALLEGDATWASVATVAGGGLDDDTRARVLRQLDQLPAELAAALPDVPPLLRDTLAFQYRSGSAFVDRLLAVGGWAAVDRAHADPPASSEQVLHPERYLAARRDDPAPIAVGGTELLAHAGYTPVLDDTLGEVVVRILLGRTLPPERAARVAAGWHGDLLVAFARDADLVVVWMTAWDGAADATEFAAAVTDCTPAAHVERRQSRVLVLLGSWPPGLPARIWDGSGQAEAVVRLRDHGPLARELPQVRPHRETGGPA